MSQVSWHWIAVEEDEVAVAIMVQKKKKIKDNTKLTIIKLYTGCDGFAIMPPIIHT